jgi:MFS family permease
MSSGLSMTLIASQLVFQVLAEGPTGALADAYGRARAIAMSFWCRFVAIILIIACVIVGLQSNSSGAARSAVAAALILAQIAMATGEAFLEGSIEAWLCDECKTADPENYIAIINRTFDWSALIQNMAILLSITTVLLTWRLAGSSGGIILAVIASLLCLAGAVISPTLSSHEKFAVRNVQQPQQRF